MIGKLLVVLLVMVFLAVSVTAVFASQYNVVRWSNPSVVSYINPPSAPIKDDCPRAEVNQRFEDYRDGLISKEDMIAYVGGCKWQ